MLYLCFMGKLAMGYETRLDILLLLGIGTKYYGLHINSKLRSANYFSERGCITRFALHTICYNAVSQQSLASLAYTKCKEEISRILNYIYTWLNLFPAAPRPSEPPAQ